MLINKQAKKEANKLKKNMRESGLPESKISLLTPIIENVAWMKVKLDEAREVNEESNVAIPYDNGGGQKGLRENPLFKGYESLWKSYMAGMQKIIDSIPDSHAEIKQEEIQKSVTMLEVVRARKKAQ